MQPRSLAEIMPQKMKYRITRRDLMQLLEGKELSNFSLKDCHDNGFFELGASNKDREKTCFELDFIKRSGTCNELSLKNLFANESPTLENIKLKLAEIFIIDQESALDVVNAYTQGASAMVVNILNFGRPLEEIDRYVIDGSKYFTQNLFKNEDGQIVLQYSAFEFEIVYVGNTAIQLWLCPVTALFTLSHVDGKLGFILEYIETDNQLLHDVITKQEQIKLEQIEAEINSFASDLSKESLFLKLNILEKMANPPDQHVTSFLKQIRMIEDSYYKSGANLSTLHLDVNCFKSVYMTQKIRPNPNQLINLYKLILAHDEACGVRGNSSAGLSLFLGGTALATGALFATGIGAPIAAVGIAGIGLLFGRDAELKRGNLRNVETDMLSFCLQKLLATKNYADHAIACLGILLVDARSRGKNLDRDTLITTCINALETTKQDDPKVFSQLLTLYEDLKTNSPTSESAKLVMELIDRVENHYVSSALSIDEQIEPYLAYMKTKLEWIIKEANQRSKNADRDRRITQYLITPIAKVLESKKYGIILIEVETNLDGLARHLDEQTRTGSTTAVELRKMETNLMRFKGTDKESKPAPRK